MGAVLGDYNPEAGAWIRFNPMDGKDVKMKISQITGMHW